jgi:tetratricopeptide (TPR) repeat protein
VNTKSARYCDCGTRLARDNPSSRCGACQAKARDLVVRSPEVPAKFWATDRMRDSLATWHMGRVVAAYRNHPFHGRPLPQETVAGWVGITQAQLSRIESGPPIKDLERLIEWARVLHIPTSLLWFKLPEQRLAQAPEEPAQPRSEDGPVGSYPLASKRAASVLDMVTSDDALVATPALAVRLAHEWLVTEPPQIVETRAGRQIGEGLTRTVEQRVEQLRHMDDFIGGNDLYALVAKELRTTVSILKEAGYSEMLGKRFLTAVGELCQLAGWTAADAGLPVMAQRYYAAGIHAAHEADNAALAANLISSLSYLYSNVGNLGEAVLLAHTAYAGARHRASAATQALLQERIAWAHARAGELRQTQRALDEAELAYEHRNPADDPPWVYWLDRDEIDVMAGRCYTELHRPRQAEPLLRSVLDHYSEDRVRESVLYTSWLAEGYVQAEDIDQAAAQATRALILSTRVNSSRSRERVQFLRRRLAGAPHARSVRDFEELYRELQVS